MPQKLTAYDGARDAAGGGDLAGFRCIHVVGQRAHLHVHHSACKGQQQDGDFFAKSPKPALQRRSTQIEFGALGKKPNITPISKPPTANAVGS